MNNDKEKKTIVDFDWDAYEKMLQNKEPSEPKYHFKEKDIVDGIIISINKIEVVVDLVGEGVSCIVPFREFGHLVTHQIGDSVKIYIKKIKKNGFEVSYRIAKKILHLSEKWPLIIEAFKENKTVKGFNEERVHGGIIVDIFGIKAFLPNNQIDVRPIRNYDVFLGKNMEFKIVKINQETKDFIVSHKAIMIEEIEKLRAGHSTPNENKQITENKLTVETIQLKKLDWTELLSIDITEDNYEELKFNFTPLNNDFEENIEIDKTENTGENSSIITFKPRPVYNSNEYVFTHGRIRPCPFCGSNNVDSYIDGSAECKSCGGEFYYA